MSSPKEVPQAQVLNSAKLAGSPMSPTGVKFLAPSPVPCRRTRTKSMSELAAEGPSYRGVVKEFCREKGHGFIVPDEDSSALIFVHISDIEEEWVPKAGDYVTYKTIPCPPKMVKQQAVHVHITHLQPGVQHEKWSS